MTKKRLQFWVLSVMGLYLVAILIGICLKVIFPIKDDPVYSTFKDLIPFILAIPAAWLGFCFSRRLSFLSQLRALWSHLVETVQAAVQYTHLPSPTREEYSTVMKQISSAIDEVRGSFKNVGENNNDIGLFPFEELKDIHKLVSNLGYGDTFKADQAATCRREIGKRWGSIRRPFLSEFERQEPSIPSSPFVE